MKTRNIFTVGNNEVNVKIVNADYLKGEAPKELEVLNEYTFNVAALPTDLMDGEHIRTLAAYGLSSLMQDRCSSLNDKALNEMGISNNLDAAQARLNGYHDVYNLLATGNFKQERASGAGKTAAIDTYFAAGFANYLVSVGKDVDVVTATTLLQGMSKDERAALRKHEAIAACIMQAKKDAAQAASEIDLTDLLGG